MARLLKFVALFLVLVVLLVVGALLLVDREWLLAMASERLEAETGTRLAVRGDVALTLFPRLSLQLQDATLETPEDGPTLRAGDVGIGLAVMPLFSGSAEIDRLYLEDGEITTVTDSAAAARAAAAATTEGLSRAELDALYAARREARKAAAAGVEALALPLALDVGELSIRNLRLRTVDGDGEVLSTVELERFGASGLNTAGRETPLQLRLSVPDTAGGPPLGITAEGRIRTDLGAGRIDLFGLAVTVTGATAAPLEIELSGQYEIASEVAELDIDLAVDDTRGEGRLRYASFESPRLDATLSLNRFTPAVLALAGPEAAAADEGGDGRIPYDALRAMDTAARLSIDEVVLGPHRLSAVRASLRAVEGRVSLSEVSGEVHGGTLGLEATLDAHYGPATLESRGAVTELAIGSALEALESPLAATGTASLTWDVDSRGDDTDALLQALTGAVTLRTDAVTVRNISVQRDFCRVVALANGDELSEPFPGDTAFEALEADLSLGGGSARLDRMTATLRGIALAGTGELALAEGDFTATVGGRLQPALAELDPACGVDERLTALTFPVACEGNLAGEPKEWCAVDAEAIVSQAVQNEARRRLEEEAGKLFKRLLDED